MGRLIRNLKPWPSGTPLPADGLFIFYDFASDAEYRVLAEQLLVAAAPSGNDFVPIAAAVTHPAFASQDELNHWLLARQPTINQVVQAAAPPKAPTGGQVDDTGDTFSVLVVVGYASYVQYWAFFPGSNGNVLLTSDIAYQVGNRIYLKYAGAAKVGEVGIGVAPNGSLPAGDFCTNQDVFTGAVVVTPPVVTNTPPTVSLNVQKVATGYKYTASATDSDGIKSITIHLYLAADDSEVDVFGPSVTGSTSYLTTRPAPAAGDYYAVAIATDTKDLPGNSPQVPFTVAGTVTTPPTAGTTGIFESQFESQFE